MSGAAEAVQRAIVAALRPIGPAVLDGLPAGPVLPAYLIADGTSLDWSTKDRRGRELRVAVSVLAEAGAAAVLHGHLAAAEAAIEAMPRDLPGHRVASVVLLRSRIERGDAAVWTARTDWRVRTLEA